MSFNGGNSFTDIRSTVDGFGRPILSQRLQGPGATNYDTKETDFNVIGLPSRIIMPFGASADGTNSSAAAVNATYETMLGTWCNRWRRSSCSDAGSLRYR